MTRAKRVTASAWSAMFSPSRDRPCRVAPIGAQMPASNSPVAAPIAAVALESTSTTVAAGTFLPVKGRVARALLDLAKAFGNEVDGGRIVIRQKLSQSDVAAMAGIARENVSRILNEWMRLKLVTRLSGYYCIENKAKLEKELKI